jgi:hypothetical protein
MSAHQEASRQACFMSLLNSETGDGRQHDWQPSISCMNILSFCFSSLGRSQLSEACRSLENAAFNPLPGRQRRDSSQILNELDALSSPFEREAVSLV